MAITLKESRALADIADLLYTFLPGSGHPSWTGHVSFKSISAKIELEQFWQYGSKLPMIIGLLERTLEHRRNLFQKLILEVVREGIKYRQRKGEPVVIKEIQMLNGLLIDVGFKFPELWDSAFLDSLKDGGIRAKENLDRIIQEKKIEVQESRNLSKELRRLKEEFFILQRESNRNKAGIELQGILKQLFALSGLEPRKPFRVIGEEIDGSFELDHEIYLLEAMWEKNPSHKDT